MTMLSKNSAAHSQYWHNGFNRPVAELVLVVTGSSVRVRVRACVCVQVRLCGDAIIIIIIIVTQCTQLVYIWYTSLKACKLVRSNF